MRTTHSTIKALPVIVLAILLPTADFAMKGPRRNPFRTKDHSSVALSPLPSTFDEIIHNVGNIRTTVDNLGYIGGYRYYNLPSGEWPRNSGHDYIGEIKYWMGGITPAGDTMVDNTWDEFQGMPDLVNGSEEYKILLSTDTTRYAAFNRGDTVGLGIGNPARGWRVWNPETSQWTYNKDYYPPADSFLPGGPASLQESHYRFNDGGSVDPLGPMGLEITHTMMQWNYCYNEDFTYVILQIKNTSAVDYTNFCFGLYVDLDIGGPDGTGENGRLGDSVGYDIAKNLAWNLQASPSYDPGWGPLVTPGFFGAKLLETPDNIGLTALRTGQWEQVPTDAPIDDKARYQLIADSAYDTPLPPADQYFIMCTRGINLTAGKTIRVVYALVAGQDEATFKANADRAQYLYDKHYVGPQPPTAPTLLARAGDRRVYLSWNDTAEVSVDPLSGQHDFAGYKLYRSENQGKSWGRLNEHSNNSCLTTDYFPIAAYGAATPGDPIPHTFIDSGLYNGVDYWYCLAAYDKGDPSVPVDVLQSGFGSPGVTINVANATPSKNPAGYYSAAASVVHDFSGAGQKSQGSVLPVLFDKAKLKGSQYEVVFQDTPEQTYWHLINMTTGDTVLKNQIDVNVNPQLVTLVDGLRVLVSNPDRVPAGYGQTTFIRAESTLVARAGYPFPYNPAGTSGDAPYRPTFELRYSADSTEAPNLADPSFALYKVPFEAWNTTTNTRVSLAAYDGTLGGVWNHYNGLAVVDYPYTPLSASTLIDQAYPYSFSWYLKFDTAYFHPVAGDRFTLAGAPVNGPGDKFVFKIDGVDPLAASHDLSKIKVVPDPYLAQYSSRVETADGQSVIEFQSVPDQCTIRIYTLAGDLIQTLQHNSGTGTARWNLLTSGQQQIASGIYIYHVESPYGTKLGRFSVIK